MASIQETFAVAVAHYQAGRVAEAEQTCRQILMVDENCASAWNFLGVIELERRNFDAAVYCLQSAIWLVPSWAEAHHNLGLAIHEGGRPSAAIEHYRRALEIRPDYAHSHVNLANALKLQGQVDEAIAHYREALAAKPDF